MKRVLAVLLLTLFLAACASPGQPREGAGAGGKVVEKPPEAGGGPSGGGGEPAEEAPEPPESKQGEELRRRATVTNVIDGDTLDVRLEDGGTERIRLLGVDTPETWAENEPEEFEGVPETQSGRVCLREWGRKADEFTESVLEGREVLLDTGGRGYYGRLLAYIYIGEEDESPHGYDLVSRGLARVYTEADFSLEEQFLRAESVARESGKGLWSCASPAEEAVSPPQPTAGDRLKVAAFNIQVFGKTKAGKPEDMGVLSDIAREFDLIAVQEIRDKSGSTMPKYLELVNAMEGPEYDFIIGPRLGRTTSKEQYAYLYNTEAIRAVSSETYPEPEGDVFHREPFIVFFEVLGRNFDFVLITVHTDPDEAAREINHLPNVVEYAGQRFQGEGDFIILGDLNADCRYFDEEGASPLKSSDYTWIIGSDADTTPLRSDLEGVTPAGEQGTPGGVCPGRSSGYHPSCGPLIGTYRLAWLRVLRSPIPLEPANRYLPVSVVESPPEYHLSWRGGTRTRIGLYLSWKEGT